MAEQYSRFIVRGVKGVIGKVDGHSTINENIADNVGLSLAWDAHRTFMETTTPDTKGVKAEIGDMRFFIAFGQSWCSKSDDAYLEDELNSENHSPSQWRVNGAVMNNDAFATIFHCDQGTPMHPIDKCKIW